MAVQGFRHPFGLGGGGVVETVFFQHRMQANAGGGAGGKGVDAGCFGAVFRLPCRRQPALGTIQCGQEFVFAGGSVAAAA